MTQLAPGVRALIRDEEWLIRRADPSADGGWQLTFDGISGLVRGQTALFLTSIEDDIDVLKPAETFHVSDESPTYNATMLYPESQRRRTVPNDTPPCGPRRVTRTFTAPFACANREDNYRTSWVFLQIRH